MLSLKNKLYKNIYNNIVQKIYRFRIEAIVLNKNRIIKNKNISIEVKPSEEEDNKWLNNHGELYKFKVNANKDFKSIYLQLEINNDLLILGPFDIFCNYKSNIYCYEFIVNNYKQYKINSNEILVKELINPFFYGRVWETNFVLLDYFKSILNPEFFYNKSVIDISGGTGFLGIALSSLLNKYNTKITITEHKDKISLLRDNVSINSEFTKNCVKVKPLIWNTNYLKT